MERVWCVTSNTLLSSSPFPSHLLSSLLSTPGFVARFLIRFNVIPTFYLLLWRFTYYFCFAATEWNVLKSRSNYFLVFQKWKRAISTPVFSSRLQIDSPLACLVSLLTYLFSHFFSHSFQLSFIFKVRYERSRPEWGRMRKASSSARKYEQYEEKLHLSKVRFSGFIG